MSFLIVFIKQEMTWDILIKCPWIIYSSSAFTNNFIVSFVDTHSWIKSFTKILFFHSFRISISSSKPVVKMSTASWIKFPIFFFCSALSDLHSFLACWRASGVALLSSHRYSHASFFSCIQEYVLCWLLYEKIG